MFRKTLALAMFTTLVASFAGCGGYSEEKAKSRCDQELPKVCVTDESYDECVSCYMECGEACAAQAECPETYSCE